MDMHTKTTPAATIVTVDNEGATVRVTFVKDRDEVRIETGWAATGTFVNTGKMTKRHAIALGQALTAPVHR